MYHYFSTTSILHPYSNVHIIIRVFNTEKTDYLEIQSIFLQSSRIKILYVELYSLINDFLDRRPRSLDRFSSRTGRREEAQRIHGENPQLVFVFLVSGWSCEISFNICTSCFFIWEVRLLVCLDVAFEHVCVKQRSRQLSHKASEITVRSGNKVVIPMAYENFLQTFIL